MEEKKVIAKVVHLETGEILDDVYEGDRIIHAKEPEE